MKVLCSLLLSAFALTATNAQFETGRELRTSKASENECTMESRSKYISKVCGPKAQCVDEEFGFSCSCKPGYFAIADELISYCADLDECASGIAQCDATNGFCVDWDPDIFFKCGCNAGYTCQNDACTRCVRDTAHPCSTNNGGCSLAATCNALANDQFTCTCNPPFEGDGISCTRPTVITPTPAPTFNPNTCDSIACDSVSSSCEPVKGNPTCVCKTGFLALSNNCVDIDECRTADLNTCPPDGRSVCVNMPGTFRCQCATGFIRFPGTISGTDCRTEAEIRAAFDAGAIFIFDTGVAGFSVAQFTAAAQNAYVIALAAQIGINVTSITISNFTDTTSSRRLSADGTFDDEDEQRMLQNALPTTVWTVTCQSDLQTTSSEVAYEDDGSIFGFNTDSAISKINAEVNKCVDMYIRLETAGSNAFANLLAAFFPLWVASEPAAAAFESDAKKTDIVAITLRVGFLSFGTPEATVGDQVIDGTGPSPAPVLALTSAPTPAPSATGSRRQLFKEVEEEDFFGSIEEGPLCSCVDCVIDTECGGLWKGSSVAEATAEFEKVELVIAHCEHSLDWIKAFTEGVQIGSTTVISKCGKEAKLAGATILEVDNVGRNDQSYAQWIFERVSGAELGVSSDNTAVVFLKDDFDKTNMHQNGEQRTLKEMLRVASATGFACGIQPGELSLQKMALSVSVYHDYDTMSTLSMDSYGRGSDKYGFTDVADFKSGFKNLGDFVTAAGIKVAGPTVPVCYGGVFAVKESSLKMQSAETWAAVSVALSRGDNIEEGHFMERLWAAAVSAPLTDTKAQSIIQYADFESENDEAYFGTLMHSVAAGGRVSSQTTSLNDTFVTSLAAASEFANTAAEYGRKLMAQFL